MRLRKPARLGKKGILPAGSLFQAGYSLLGDFRVNAILSALKGAVNGRKNAVTESKRHKLTLA